MANIYKTAEVARLVGVHPNTVRLYEQIGFIPQAKRLSNGYRVFTERHIDQFRLARTALKVEVLQSGLRKTAVSIIRLSAQGHFGQAAALADSYHEAIHAEYRRAEEALALAREILAGTRPSVPLPPLRRKEAADYLHITMESLRNWERNGLLTAKRSENGYRVYFQEDIRRLKIIRTLRGANYSLASILRLMNTLNRDPGADIRSVVASPGESEDLISVCDRLIPSLEEAAENAQQVRLALLGMKKKYGTNPPL